MWPICSQVWAWVVCSWVRSCSGVSSHTSWLWPLPPNSLLLTPLSAAALACPAVPRRAVAAGPGADQVALGRRRVIGGLRQGVQRRLGRFATRSGRDARFALAVVEAGDDHRAVDVVVQESHQHLLPDAGDELVAHAGAREALHHAQPAAVVAGAALWGVQALPVKAHLHAAHLVGVQLVGAAGLFVAFGADDDGGLRAQGRG